MGYLFFMRAKNGVSFEIWSLDMITSVEFVHDTTIWLMFLSSRREGRDRGSRVVRVFPLKFLFLIFFRWSMLQQVVDVAPWKMYTCSWCWIAAVLFRPLYESSRSSQLSTGLGSCSYSYITNKEKKICAPIENPFLNFIMEIHPVKVQMKALSNILGSVSLVF